jgi:hypothetical protein
VVVSRSCDRSRNWGDFILFFASSTSTLLGLGILGFLVRDGLKSSGEAVGGALVKAALLVGKDAAVSGNGGAYFPFGVVSGAVGAALSLTSLKMRFLK